MIGEFADIPAGLGEAGTGALAARAVEPAHGKADGHTHEGICLNCDTVLVGPYCRACGQRAHVHRTLGAFFHDLLHGVLHFEGKTWRTLPLLVWKPGMLTREYIDGKRARYVSPIALFLFVVFLSFALFSALGGSGALDPELDGLDQVTSAYATNAKEIAELRGERAAAGPPETAEIDRRIAELEEDQTGLRLILGNESGEIDENLGTGPLAQDNPLTRAFEQVQANPQLAIYKLQTNAYKFSWMLIPLSVPFVWLLFPFNRRFGGYDHTVFTTYSIAFMIALVAAASVLGYFGYSGVGLMVLFYAPLHMYRQLRGAYTLGRWGALWRMAVLSVFAWIAIGLFAVLIMWMGSGS